VSIIDSAGVVVVEVGPLEAVVAPPVSLGRVYRTSGTGVELFRVSSAIDGVDASGKTTLADELVVGPLPCAKDRS
jgi:hypothetical protein